MTNSTLGVVHLVFAFVAIAAGAGVLFMAKGTRWHRTVGHLYVTSMVGLNVSALAIYDLTGSFGPFHVFALVALLVVGIGMWTVLARRPRRRWIDAHARWMASSYMGLMAAFVAESATRFVMPRVEPHLDGPALWGAFWTAVAVASGATIAVGLWLIRTRMDAAVASTPAAMRREREELRAG